MKTIKYKGQLIIAMHLLFWIVSFNAFNLFFSRGVASGFVLEGFELTWGNVLFISNVLLLFISLPFVWIFKGIKRWIKFSITTVAVLILGWSALLLFYPNISHQDDNNIITAIIFGYFLDNFLYVLIFHITIIAAVYLNIKLLIKKYLSQGKFGLYLSWAIGLAVIAGIINYALFDLCIDLVFPELFYISWFKTWELILIMAGYMAITTTAFLLWQYGLMLIANREKAINELSVLKAQINPHFLFNNLNTIYALAVKGDDRTKEVILQLSDFLRYVLYDTSSDKIKLEKEIEIIKTYVGLQKERINQNITEIVLNIEGEFKGASIAPLLLLPLAENCFKHGIGKDRGTIKINIHYSDHQLRFWTINPVVRREDPVNNDPGGIGIKNVEKRLNLLYPGKHLLRFTEEENLYVMEMTIDLD